MIMTQGLLTTAYIAASILFILALGGLSNQESARRGNLFGILGMAIALGATIAGAQVTSYTVLTVCMGIGAVIGIIVAARVQMTDMPQLVAILHSFVGLAAVFIGFASYLDP
jgi:H+-translocating NAD(P) transhydrogenase subunit beta